MRIVHTSDWHLGKYLDGNSRLPEQVKFIDYFVEKMEELKPDMIVIAGDIYDTANPPAQAEELFYEALKKLSRRGECLTFIIAGNHDMPQRLTAATPLAREHGIVMIGTLENEILSGAYGKHEVGQLAKGAYELNFDNGETAVVTALPYPSESSLGEVLYNIDQDEAERAKTYAQRIGEIWEELEKYYRNDTVNLAVSHLFALKDYDASSERASTLGSSFLVGRQYLPKKADYMALGHIHKAMNVDGQGLIRYSGSPLHYSIAETAHEKKFFVIDAKAGETACITEEIIPVFKPIEKWKAGSIADAIEMCREHAKDDSWVYLQVDTDREIWDDEIKEMKAAKKDIIEIHPNIKQSDEERQDGKISELSFEEQFVEYYKFKKGGTLPPNELMEIFREIVLQAEEGEE